MSDVHSADGIMKSARGFMASRLLLTGAELDLFTLLASEFMTAGAVAAARQTDLRGTTILLDALTALGFLIKEDGRYRCEASSANLLSSDVPDSALPMVLHAATLWNTWSRLTDVVRGNVVPGLEDIGALGEEGYTSFIGAMHAIGTRLAPEAVAVVEPQGATSLIDVGGGSGAYTLAFLRACPGMRATLFDLPRVIEIARGHVQSSGMAERVRLVAGDFYRDALPGGHDMALLSAIIHQNSPAQNLALFKKVFHALEPGGRIVVRDHVMAADRTQPPAGALFAVNMLVGTAGGRTYTLDEIRSGLQAAGFEGVNLIQTKEMLSLVEAFRPA
jgi:ubiquinone/menaquinone biosynthesis C-methylase UbiE